MLNAAAPGECQEQGYRAWLRRKVVRESDLAKYGLRLEDGWDRSDPNKPLVIMIHGFNSTPEQNVSLMLPIRAAGFPCATFAYPNDYFIRSSAQLLSNELRNFASQNPHRRVILVCHSMGGLVARACVEDPLYDPGNVDRLIMIAPPTHGTFIAHFAVGTDLWEHWLSRATAGRGSGCETRSSTASEKPQTIFAPILISSKTSTLDRRTPTFNTLSCSERARP